MTRKRKYRPRAVEDAVKDKQRNEHGFVVCGCGCGEYILDKPIDYDHDPALHTRPFDEETNDYIPPENDPAHIYILIRGKGHHLKKTTREAKAAGKVRDIQRKKLGTVEKGKDRATSNFRSRGFDKTRTRHFDGRVTKRGRA